MSSKDDAAETDRFPAIADVEAVFSEFVRNANQAAKQERTRRAVVVPEGGVLPPPTDDSVTVLRARPDAPLLLTRRKPGETDPGTSLAPDPASPDDVTDYDDETPARPPGETTQRREAHVVVPQVRSVQKPRAPLPEGSEDGQIPSHELDRVLADMTVLLRYGHAAQVRNSLEQLAKRYPQDLLLLRRITEFQLQNDDVEGGIEALFILARRLFERRNLAGMREALDQVLALDADNPRARKLLALLEKR